MESLKEATSYDDFDTDAYYKKYRVPSNSAVTSHKFIKFVLDFMHEVFNSGSITGKRLLDVGTGASFISFLSASRCVQEIHLSDLLQRHRDILQSWLEGEDLENDMVDYIIEKEHDGINREKRLMELRRKVTSIKSIDVTKEPPLQEPDEGIYDIITSAFCLEVATKSVPEFKMAVERIGRLLNHGGFLILIGSLQENFYIVGNVKFWNACVNKEDVTSALIATGFTILSWRFLKKDPGPYEIDERIEYEGFFAVEAQKIS